jgi:archaellum biogenesis ATPase FlaH
LLILYFGSNDKSGFGNNKDEKEALKTLYRSNINPMREVIIDSLEYLIGFSEPNISLKFKDFEELIGRGKITYCND